MIELKARLGAILTIVLFAVPAHPVRADNGEIARAELVSGVTVDGDLSDWPAHLVRYPIGRLQGEHDGDDDFDASVRVGYDTSDGYLYVAVEVIDDIHVVGRDDLPFDQQDACIFYVDATHSPRGSGAPGYIVAGEEEHIWPASSVVRANGQVVRGAWDPLVERSTWDDADKAVLRTKGKTIYEFRARIGPGLSAGKSYGLDLIVIDLDAPEGPRDTTYSSWGPDLAKTGRAGHCGDVWTAPPSVKMGVLRGIWRWDENGENRPNIPVVRIASIQDPELWYQAHTDESGQYQVELPVGEYIVTCPFPILGDPYHVKGIVIADDIAVRAEVREGMTTQAHPLVLTTAPDLDLMQDRGVLFDFDENTAAEVDQFVKATMEHFHIPGASVALVVDRKLVYHKAFGVKNAYTQEPVEDTTLFEAASITKIVFAFAVHRLAERGVIDLDAPLHEILPFESAAGDERVKLLTARLILSHQTGLPNWGSKFAFDPGTGFSYSGTAFQYLARVVEHVTGEPLEETLMREVQIPMGFAYNTHFSASEELIAVTAHGHDGILPYSSHPPARIGVAHSMYTEAEALSHFMTGLMERKGLRSETYEEMLRFTTESDPPNTYEAVPWPSGFGLGFSMMESPYGKVYGHGGNNGSFHGLFEIYDEHDIGFIAFANNEKGWTFTELLRKFLITGKDK